MLFCRTETFFIEPRFFFYPFSHCGSLSQTREDNDVGNEEDNEEDKRECKEVDREKDTENDTRAEEELSAAHHMQAAKDELFQHMSGLPSVLLSRWWKG